jgi:hypothetical protein
VHAALVSGRLEAAFEHPVRRMQELARALA